MFGALIGKDFPLDAASVIIKAFKGKEGAASALRPSLSAPERLSNDGNAMPASKPGASRFHPRDRRGSARGLRLFNKENKGFQSGGATLSLYSPTFLSLNGK